MRLMKPSPGELADRQTILGIKLDHIDINIRLQKDEVKKEQGVVRQITRVVVEDKNKTNAHPFVDELELVQAYLLKNWMPDIQDKPEVVAMYDDLYDKLGDTNAALWDLEDKIRVLKSAPDRMQEQANARVAEVAFAIVGQNDKRAELVQKINSLWNIKGKEKLYV